MAESITFDRSLYLPEAVEAAATAYAEHAQIEITPSADAVMTVITAIGGHDTPTVARSFSNHVLYETIVRQRHAALEDAG